MFEFNLISSILSDVDIIGNCRRKMTTERLFYKGNVDLHKKNM